MSPHHVTQHNMEVSVSVCIFSRLELERSGFWSLMEGPLAPFSTTAVVPVGKVNSSSLLPRLAGSTDTFRSSCTLLFTGTMRSISIFLATLVTPCMAAAGNLNSADQLAARYVARPHAVYPRQVASHTSPTAPQQTGTIAGCSLWYNIASGDTCATVAGHFNMPLSQFLRFNPAVNSDCSQNFWLGYAYCVRVGPAVPSTPTGPTFEGTDCKCNKFYTVVSGDDCQSVATKFGITTSEFFQYNPAVDSNCANNFWIGNSYCVGVSGASTCPATTTATTTTTMAPGATTNTLTGTAIGSPSPAGPTFTGIPCQCNEFHPVSNGDTCDTIAAQYAITTAQFLEWNPAVSSDCSSNFWIGNWYCVGVTGDPECPVASTTSEEPVTTAGPTPASATFPGIPCECSAFYKLLPDDTCESVFTRFNIDADDFFDWNPEVSRNCTFNFYIGYSYCVGVGAAGSCTVTSSFTGTGSNTATDYSYVSDGTKATLAPRPTATDFPPSPVQDGAPINCESTFYFFYFIFFFYGIESTQLTQERPAKAKSTTKPTLWIHATRLCITSRTRCRRHNCKRRSPFCS